MIVRLLLAISVTGLPVTALASASSLLACGGNVSPVTMAALISAESSGNSYAVHVNGGYALPRQPRSYEEAVSTARWLTQNGFNYDSGLGQINSANAPTLGLEPEDLFKPCVNVRASAKILTDCYRAALAQAPTEQVALRRALSCYNTGNQSRGFGNGYVARVENAAELLKVPALMADGATETRAAPSPQIDVGQGAPKPAPTGPSASHLAADESAGAFASPDKGAFGDGEKGGFPKARDRVSVSAPRRHKPAVSQKERASKHEGLPRPPEPPQTGEI